MFEQDGSIVCHLHRRQQDTPAHYGMLICDLVRHVARAFKVSEGAVREWVDKERDHPMTDITQTS